MFSIQAHTYVYKFMHLACFTDLGVSFPDVGFSFPDLGVSFPDMATTLAIVYPQMYMDCMVLYGRNKFHCWEYECMSG